MNKNAKTGGLTLLLAAFIVVPVAVRAQTRIDNPKRPLAKNAGRVVELEEVLRIRDDGEQTVFRVPRDLAMGADGSLYFTDHADAPRLYHYGPRGEPIARILKKGQGPGEIQHAMGYLITGDRIRVLAWNPPKIMDFSLDGRYLREARVEEDTHGLWFLGQADGRIYGIRDEIFATTTFKASGSFTALTVPNSVYEISPDFRIWKKLYEFPVRMMVRRGSGYRLDPIDARIAGTMVYIVHTAEYQVTAFDLRAGRVEHVITRTYDRVRARARNLSEPDPDPEMRGVDVPDDPFVWDINRIQAAAGKLFVFTSTIGRGGDDHWVDIFDAEGRYIDGVVLRFPPGGRDHRSRWTILTDDGFFIIPEQEADGLVSIGKYRIPDPGLFPSQAGPKRAP